MTFRETLFWGDNPHDYKHNSVLFNSMIFMNVCSKERVIVLCLFGLDACHLAVWSEIRVNWRLEMLFLFFTLSSLFQIYAENEFIPSPPAYYLTPYCCFTEKHPEVYLYFMSIYVLFILKSWYCTTWLLIFCPFLSSLFIISLLPWGCSWAACHPTGVFLVW